MLVEFRECVENRQTGACSAFSIIVMRLRIAEVGHHAVAKIFGDVTAESAYPVSGGTMIRSYRLLPFLGIEPCRNLGRTDQITEKHRQMAPLAGQAAAAQLRLCTNRRSRIEWRAALAAEM